MTHITVLIHVMFCQVAAIWACMLCANKLVEGTGPRLLHCTTHCQRTVAFYFVPGLHLALTPALAVVAPRLLREPAILKIVAAKAVHVSVGTPVSHGLV